MDRDFKKLEEYFKIAKSNHINFQGECHDCGEEVIIIVDLEDDGKLKIEGGSIYFPDYEKCNDFYLKCDSCYNIDPVLKNFREIPVFSRVVGFYTSTSQWNKGKISELKMRKNYKLPEKEMLKVA